MIACFKLLYSFSVEAKFMLLRWDPHFVFRIYGNPAVLLKLYICSYILRKLGGERDIARAAHRFSESFERRRQ